MSDVLDLSGADTKGFDPVPSGKYNVKINKVEMAETGPRSKVPGTPMVKIQNKILDGEYEGQIIFDQFTLPAPDVENAAKTLGFFVRFLTALGFDEAKTKEKGFDMSKLDELVGKEAVITVAKELRTDIEGEFQNSVKGYKPAGSGTGEETTGLI